MMKSLLLASCLALAYSLSSQKTTRNIATQILQGAGEPVVDLNTYNLPIEEIEPEWTLVLAQKATETQSKVQLRARSPQNYVDTEVITFPRTEERLGLQLVELAGGREDGLGITLIANVTDTGAVASSEMSDRVVPGDSIAEIALIRDRRTTQGGLSIEQEIIRIPTEGLAYDKTIEALQSLPPKGNTNESMRITLRRLRRKPRITVNLKYPPSQDEPDSTIELFAGENLRQAMLVRGIKLNDELAKRFDTKNGGNCGAGGLCRTCSVAVQDGANLLNPQRPAEQQMLKDNPRWRLACKAIVGFGMKEGNITVRVNPRQW